MVRKTKKKSSLDEYVEKWVKEYWIPAYYDKDENGNLVRKQPKEANDGE